MSESPAPARKSMGLVRNSLINSGFTLISRFTGLARDLVIGAVLGASSNIMADAYYTAQAFPNLFRRIFAEGAFTAAFVPSYSAVLEQEGQEAADRLARDALATLAFMTLVLTLVIELAMPWLMHIIKPRFADDIDKFKLAVFLTQITMPYLPCMAIVALLSGVLNARGRFIISAAVPILLNLVTLITVIPQHTPYDAALWGSIGTAIAGVVQAILLFWGVSKLGARIGFSVIPKFSREIRNLLVLAVPGALAAAATQVNVFISQNFSSAIPGATSWLAIADRFYQLPLGMVGVAIGVALLPALSRAVQANDHERAQETMDQAIVLSMAFTLPAAAALMAMPFFLIDGLYTRGHMLTTDAEWIGKCLFHYGWGVPAFVLTRILNPAFFARKDTFGPMKFAMVSVVVNLGVGLPLFNAIGAPGLAIGTSAAAWVNVALMVFTLAKRKTWMISPKAMASFSKVILSAGGMAAFCAISNHLRPAIEGVIGRALPVTGGVHAFSIFGHPYFGAKEIAVLGVCFAGLFLYIALLFVTGAVKPAELKAALRRR